MATKTLEEPAPKLERTGQEVQVQVAQQPSTLKRGWRWFVGIDANNPCFEEAVRLGQEWRNADRPTDEESK